MKVIQDISRNKANKNAFVPVSNVSVFFFFLSETLHSPHTNQTGNPASMGLDKTHPTGP